MRVAELWNFLVFEWRRRWDFNGAARRYGISALAVALMTVVGCTAELTGVVEAWFGSPYVALVAVLASRYGARVALFATVLASLALANFFFHQHGLWWLPTTSQTTIILSMLAVALLIPPRRQPPETPRVLDAGADLPFTSKRTNNDERHGLHGNGRNYWDVNRSGAWQQDCHVGAEYARIFLARLVRLEPRPMLCWIVHDMIRRGHWSGVEAGFISALERAMTPLRGRPKHDADNGGSDGGVLETDR